MKDFFDTWKFKILVAVAVFLVGIMAYAGANGRLTAAPQELLGVILTPFQKAGAVVSGGVGAMWEKICQHRQGYGTERAADGGKRRAAPADGGL
ncbi:hypothetical protein [Faecalibacterium prausnitzii]|uniref:hypothetical protein n=1 Tax=Faecalibacterium prausnitzii TaxID=853 RepID=UPI0003070F9B|nr:hypothetical protein [Faecalibacterium prausnitzii]